MKIPAGIKSSFPGLEKLFECFLAPKNGDFFGFSGCLASLLLARLSQEKEINLIVTPTLERAKRLYEEAFTWCRGAKSRLKIFISDRKSVYDLTIADPEVLRDRLFVMGMDLSEGGIVITPVSALAERFFSPDRWKKNILRISSGAFISRETLVQKLVSLGFKRESTVEEPCKFAIRGSLIDVFSPNCDFPARLDFFGDEIESIKTFSPTTQRTLEKIDNLNIFPAFETILNTEEINSIQNNINKRAQELDPTRYEILSRRREKLLLNPDSRDFREMLAFKFFEHSFLWEYWENFNLWVENPEECIQEIENFDAYQEKLFFGLSDLTVLSKPSTYYFSPKEIVEAFEKKGFSTFNPFKETPTSSGIRFSVENHISVLDPSRESFLKEIRECLEQNWAVAVAIEDNDRFHNIKGLLGERKLPVHSSPDPLDFKYGSILLLNGTAKKGFIAREQKFAVFCEEDIFGTIAKPKPKGRYKSSPSPLSISQLVIGDLVVHSDHGIAEYKGIHAMAAGGIEREYLILQYAGSDRLHVPTDQVHKVQKYIGIDGFRPTIHGLNSKVWENQKRKVQKNVEIVARELLELYAKRHASSGFPFPTDNELQKTMESLFPYRETPDQMKAIQYVKEDMESDLPMDRLICGDVGYGKTEVALRAAFKAVCGGKQAAVLAPTTLLAFQHHQTFTERFKGFPVRIGMVSRLVKPPEQRELIKKAEAGAMDILIGTHRILSNDVKFKDLGLVIIDEEQRFGVKHKENFKKIRASVDVLTLTATPIPRTMQMALSGIRSISVIDTPPEDRRPINTYVAPYDPGWAKKAILDELKRGGQVYYVFNRVEKLPQKYTILSNLVPEARIITAHGQMNEEEIETHMLAFIKGEYDVLLATTIIESGLDIPNVNTLIVDEAERLGLAQMYQLRGRVGRSNRQAWAYFFYTKGKALTPDARERLATIEEHTALGSGFKIALRDLQIRGAGSILGESQSGHIASIGFAHYIELLEEAVKRVKGEKIERPPETAIEIPVAALFPKSYIPEEEARIELYARLSRCLDVDALELLQTEIEDRFGPLPDEGRRLLRVAQLRISASKAGVNKITRILNRLRFEFEPNKTLNAAAFLDARTAFYKNITLNPQDHNAIFLHLNNAFGDEIFNLAQNFIDFAIKNQFNEN
ncbi:MAG: transcription-repair coupling factor [Candidatus Riflebacteria bacterium]|nr:transcription-repair coupling factor [Candidatus Riflebacteria bacterium]